MKKLLLIILYISLIFCFLKCDFSEVNNSERIKQISKNNRSVFLSLPDTITVIIYVKNFQNIEFLIKKSYPGFKILKKKYICTTDNFLVTKNIYEIVLTKISWKEIIE